MNPVRTVSGTAVPLPRSDVDTDQIIPSEWLKRVERTGFGQGLFAAWRDDPAFVLNRAEYASARILVAGPNFGTGSSREHAVWALMDYGFEAVVSSRFADIFRTNCTKAGLLPVEVSEADAAALMAAVTHNPATTVLIDVEALSLRCADAGIHTSFALDDFTRRRFLEGLDDIALTLAHADAITEYESTRPTWLPTTG